MKILKKCTEIGRHSCCFRSFGVTLCAVVIAHTAYGEVASVKDKGVASGVATATTLPTMPDNFNLDTASEEELRRAKIPPKPDKNRLNPSYTMRGIPSSQKSELQLS